MKKPRLVAISGPWAETIWPIRNGRLTVGRSPENDVCLDDPTVSGQHALFEMQGEQMWVHDKGSENGIAVNEIGYLDKAIFHGDIIELGITNVVYLEHDDADALPVIIRDEVDRSRKFSTLRLDKTTRDEQAIHQRSVRRVMSEMVRMLPTIPEPGAFQSRAVELAFRVIHARRGVIMINGRRTGPKPEDYSSRVWRERDVAGESPFEVSGSTLDEVYRTGEALFSNNITPVICIPIKLSKKIVGVFYLEGATGAPFDHDNLECANDIAAFVASSIALSKLVDSLDGDCERLRAKVAPDFRMIGSGPKMKEVYDLIAKAARWDVPVLITGETGTGKELVARLIHALSARKNKEMVVVNCGAIPETLAEGELCGHVKGAFTDATKDHKGQFEQADESTIFLDEIGDMMLTLQVKLHRLVEYQEVHPVGGELKDAKKVNVRVIAATRVDLEAAMDAGRFRDDLFERLNGFQIHLPALREHPEDIPELANHFVKTIGEGISGIAPEALEVLKSYHWPRNIRQLRNAIRQAIIKHTPNGSEIDLIQSEDLPEWVFDLPPAKQADNTVKKPMTKASLERCLRENDWSVKTAAAHFGCSEGWIYASMRKYGLQRSGSANA